MATLKQRLHRKNSSGSYDIVHLETSASCVLLSSGDSVESKISSMETTISGKAPSRHNHAASNITSGILGTARGGTGITANPSMLVNLGSTAAASVFATSPRPGVTGTLPVANGGTGVTTLDALKSALGISGGDTPSGGSSVGSNLTFSGYDWICVHNDGTYKWLMTKYVIGSTVFGDSNTYTSSQALLFCRLLEVAFGLTDNNQFASFTNDGVTGKLLLPTYAQMNGGFRYFSSNTNRIGTDSAGNAMNYWTSSPHGSDRVSYVYADGSLDYAGIPISCIFGFRPCVALKI